MRFIVTGFAGAIKALQNKLLPDGVGVDSTNQKPGRGDLRPWKVPLTVATVPSNRKTIYRMGRDTKSDTDYWLSWSDVVHAARGFLANDPTERTYYTGSGSPKVTDNAIGLTSPPYPTTARELGVPAPSTALILTEDTAGTGDDEERFYVQTFVTDKGEESKPSAIASITVKPGAIIDITGLAAVPAGNYGITRRRIYRTVVGSSNEAEFYLLLDIDSSDTTATDAPTAPTSIILESSGPAGTTGRAWDMPPANGKHLTPLWNGMMSLISGRSVRFCESYRPHAWPVAYEKLPADVTPVAQVVYDKNLLILTTGRPYVVTGSIPSALADDPIDFEQSCIGERSPQAIADGAAWAAPDGLAYFGSRGPGLLTKGLMEREDWQALKPETIIGAQFQGLYVGLYEPSPGTLKAFMLDPLKPTGIYFLDTGYAAAFVDKLTDALYVLDGTNVKKWDAGASFMTATFKSKVWRAPRPVNMSHLEVTADAYPVAVTITAKWVDARGVEQTVVQSRSVASSEPVTLKSGFLATDWQIEVSTAGAVQGLVIADSKRALSET